MESQLHLVRMRMRLVTLGVDVGVWGVHHALKTAEASLSQKDKVQLCFQVSSDSHTSWLPLSQPSQWCTCTVLSCTCLQILLQQRNQTT